MNIYISLIITMVFSAFFSGVEIAFVSVDKLRFEMERNHLLILRQAKIQMDSLPEYHHPPPSEKLVATLHGWYEWNCSFCHLPAAI